MSFANQKKSSLLAINNGYWYLQKKSRQISVLVVWSMGVALFTLSVVPSIWSIEWLTTQWAWFRKIRLTLCDFFIQTIYNDSLIRLMYYFFYCNLQLFSFLHPSLVLCPSVRFVFIIYYSTSSGFLRLFSHS